MMPHLRRQHFNLEYSNSKTGNFSIVKDHFELIMNQFYKTGNNTGVEFVCECRSVVRIAPSDRYMSHCIYTRCVPDLGRSSLGIFYFSYTLDKLPSFWQDQHIVQMQRSSAPRKILKWC